MKSERFLLFISDSPHRRRLRSGSQHFATEPNADDFSTRAAACASSTAAGHAAATAYAADNELPTSAAADDRVFHAATATRATADCSTTMAKHANGEPRLRRMSTGRLTRAGQGGPQRQASLREVRAVHVDDLTVID